MHHLPTPTLRDIAVVVVLMADAAWDGAKDAIARLKPYVEPPPDLGVRSSIGGLYTGILLVDRNEILAGLVFRAGQEAPPDREPVASSHRSLTSSSSPRWSPSPLSRVFEEDDEDEAESRLPGWGEDPRDARDRWRR